MYDTRSAANKERAESASQRALELDPGLAQAHASRGVALSLGGHHEEAQQAFENAIHLDPALFEAHYFYARDRYARGDLSKAIQQYEQAMAVRPEDYQSPLLASQIYASLGRESDADAARRRGLRLAEDQLRLHPHDVRALYLGANALATLGEREQALAWAERAVTIEPDDSMLLYNVACIRSLAGCIEDAIDCLERAFSHGLTQLEWYEVDADLDPLRRHPRFRALLQKMSST